MEANFEMKLNSIFSKFSLLPEIKAGKAILSEEEITFLVNTSKEIFLSQPTLLKLKSPYTVCGDIRGDFESLKKIFEKSGEPQKKNYIFLGNYINRGSNSIETLCLLLAYKIKFKDTFYMLRGHYDEITLSKSYGFYEECLKKYNENIFNLITDLLNALPLAATIDEKIFLIHGGLSPELKTLDQIEKIQRPVEIPKTGLICDLIWSDPSNDLKEKDWEENSRGAGKLFGKKPLLEFLEKNNLKMLCRGHSVVKEGYEYLWDNKVLTIFSTDKFCDDTKGAFMEVNNELKFEFKTLE